MPNRTCHACSAEIGKLPNWLEGVEVKFQCANCSTAAVYVPPPVERFSEDPDAVEEELVGSNDEEEAEDPVVVGEEVAD